MDDNTLWAIFWIGLFTCIAVGDIASELRPRIKYKEVEKGGEE